MLNLQGVITHDESLFRPSDIESIALNPTKTANELGRSARNGLHRIVGALIAGDVWGLTSQTIDS